MFTLLLNSTACFLWQNVLDATFNELEKIWPKIYSASTKSQVFIATTNMRLLFIAITSALTGINHNASAAR